MSSSIAKITHGPSKFDLMLALFDSPSPNFRHVVFHIEGGMMFEANINGVEKEDGSAESWNFVATGRTDARSDYWMSVQGYYNTISRKGVITFPEHRVREQVAHLDEIVRQTNLRQHGDGRPVRR
jgi:hypothetical protein